jgi:starch-binding outer membrane protein, SusD/RagB family
MEPFTKRISMKQRNRRLLALGLAALLVTTPACDFDRFLTGTVPGSTDIDQPRNTLDLEAILVGGYWVLGGDAGFRGMHGNQQQFPTLVADEGRLHEDLSINIGDDHREWYRWEFGTNSHAWNARYWHAGYATILQANRLIDWIEARGPFNDAEARAGWTDRILGEAYFLRAWMHFELQRLYGVPWGATPGNSSPSILIRDRSPRGAYDNPGLSTTQEVYALIASDIERAVQLLPAQFSAGQHPQGFRMRSDRMAAHFLAARIYFQMQDWTRAEQHADAVLNSGRFPLTEDPLQAWNRDEWGDLGREVVFGYYTAGQQLNWKPPVLARWYGYADGNGRWARNCANNRCNFNAQVLSLSDHFMAVTGWNDPAAAQQDKRLEQLFMVFGPGQDPRALYRPLDTRRIWGHKWYRSGNGGAENPNTNNRVATLPLMRSAEMHLTRAYLRLQRGDGEGARADLNEVRRRAGIGNYTGPMTAEVIEVERMKEMALEGDRLWYLQALQKDVPAGDRPGGSLSWQQPRLRLPDGEILLNPNIPS